MLVSLFMASSISGVKFCGGSDPRHVLPLLVPLCAIGKREGCIFADIGICMGSMSCGFMLT